MKEIYNETGENWCADVEKDAYSREQIPCNRPTKHGKRPRKKTYKETEENWCHDIEKDI